MLPLAHLCNTPVVTTLHGRLDLPDITHAFHSFPKNTFVSISDSQRKPLPALPWVSTVHHGIDIKKFRFTAEHGKYLAFLGRISPEKRPDWAIALAKKSGIPIKLAAKIEGTADEAYFEAQIKPLIDGSFVQFVGEISEDEKSDFLGNALALAFPIDWPEPFGLVTIEALACGTPVLARPCGAMPEILKDGITGFCRSDVNELTKLIPQINRLDRHKCREWVEQRFNYKRMADDYLKVYKTLSKIRTLRAA
jgi:glycosyltransferase involved in cell wall biosynthesis